MINNGIEMYQKINIEDKEENFIFIPRLNNNKKKSNIKNRKRKLSKDIIIKNKNSLTIFCIIFLFSIILVLFLFIKTYEEYLTKNINDIFKYIIKSNEEFIDKTNNTINLQTDKEDESFEKEENDNDKKIEKEKKKEEKEIQPSQDDIYKKETFDGLEASFKKAKSFLKNNMEGILLNNEPFIESTNPKVSAIIPVYNSRKIINRAIKSIQNQNMLNIEIILINDFSTDDTLSFINNLQKEDPRIKIINNKKNMGILYCRSIGALSAKGKYIFPLDNDDMFLDKNVFEIITDRAEKGNFDIIEFRGISALLPNKNILERKKKDTTFSPIEDNIVLFQPELGKFPIKKGRSYDGYRLISIFLWSKCIKTNIYKKALNLLGEERYARYMLRDEDVLAVIAIFNTAESYKFLGKYGIYHVQTAKSAGDQPDEIQMNKQKVYVFDVALEFSKNLRQNKEWIIYYIIANLNRNKWEETLKDEYINKIFISCLDRIFKTQTKYFNDKDKEEIKKRIMAKKFINYKF